MNKKTLKYLFVLTPLCVWFYFGCAGSRPAVSNKEREEARRMEEMAERMPVRDTSVAAHPVPVPENREISLAAGDAVVDFGTDSIVLPPVTEERAQELLDSAAMREQAISDLHNRFAQFTAQMHKELGGEVSPDSVRAMALEEILPFIDSLQALGMELPPVDTTLTADEDMVRRIAEMLAAGHADIAQARMQALVTTDSMTVGSLRDSLPLVRPARKPFLDDPIFSKNKDSMVYDVLGDTIWLYREADVDYQNLNIKSDILSVSTVTKMINAHGIMNDSGVVSRPIFTQGGQPMDMRIVAFNLDTKMGIVRDFSMQEGEGFMRADLVKMHPDKHFDMSEGRYTTCNLEDPHFYIRMNRGKVIPNNKVVFGMAHFVLEDVPLYFPFLPFGFFPLASGPSAGFIMPTFGEEYVKGFFIKDGGYYFRFGDYADASVTGSIYTLGSWDARMSSRYLKRYKFSGSLGVTYSKNIIGEKGSADYVNGNALQINWSHQQDAKARPNSTFSASVNYSTSGSKKYASTTVQDYINTQTSSSVSYSKTIPASEHFPGGSITVAFRHSQNARDSTISFSFPQASWRIQNFKPFRNKNRRGKEKWYEKITLSYSGGMQGSLDNIKERDLFKQETMDKLRSGIEHKVPVSASFTLFNHINITASGNFNSNWLFKKQNLWWDEVNRTVAGDTTSGFYATYDYSASASLNTKIYGMFEFKNKEGLFRAIRHTITPSVSISVKPDFGKPKYGFWRTYQNNENGSTTTYSPYSALNMYGSPGRGESATMSFSLQQNLEAKVRSKRDTTGMRKISIVENLSLSSGLNLLADSMNLNTISFTLVIPIVKEFKLNLSGSLDPYQYDMAARTRYNRMTFADGKLPRLTRMSTGFSWNWAPVFGSQATIEQFERAVAETPQMHEPESPIDYETRRALMTAAYYDFSLPFNFGFRYSMSYANDRRQRELTHSVNFNGSLTLTPYKADGQARWALSLPTIGYDFTNKKLTPGALSVVRDLHCFTMSLNWVPVGPRSWSFNIRVKSSVLQDIKYDKNRSYYDTLYY